MGQRQLSATIAFGYFCGPGVNIGDPVQTVQVEFVGEGLNLHAVGAILPGLGIDSSRKVDAAIHGRLHLHSGTWVARV
jgi:hypothetical protein